MFIHVAHLVLSQIGQAPVSKKVPSKQESHVPSTTQVLQSVLQSKIQLS